MKLILTGFVLFWIGLMILIHVPVPDEPRGEKEMTSKYGEYWRAEITDSMKTNRPHFNKMRQDYHAALMR